MKTVNDKLDKISEDISEINVTLAKQHVSLEEHIRRTKLNEIAIEKLSDNLVHVNKHVNHVEGAFKLLGIIFSGLAVLAAFLKVVF